MPTVLLSNLKPMLKRITLSANHEVKQQYLNGHFCYAYKFGILTNGLGIVRSIDFYNKDYLKSHPDIVVEKKSKSPDEDKSLADSTALLPTLKDFRHRHPNITSDIFLGYAAFDTIEIYKSLFQDFSFKKAFIPLKVKLSIDSTDYSFNENGIPCCPHDASLPIKREGSKSHLKNKLPAMKFVCPKMKWEYNRTDKSNRRVCHCDNPCTTSSCGRMIYVYPEKNLRAYPGIERGFKEWDDTYKIRVNVEKSINHFKDSFCVDETFIFDLFIPVPPSNNFETDSALPYWQGALFLLKPDYSFTCNRSEVHT